jgi:two-component system sensor histidine kinase KdpD
MIESDMKITRPMLLQYAMAVTAVTLALVSSLLLMPWLESSVFLFFFPAVMVSAWYGGLSPGLLATLLSSLAIYYFLLPPPGTLTIGLDDLPRMVVFVLMSVVISSLTDALRRSKEKLRSLTEELKRNDEMKSALLASVSHDLRTPVTSIRTAVDNLLSPTLDWDKAMLREFHLIIGEEVQRLAKLVEDLLGMARIEAGELRLSMNWGAVAEICDAALDQCAIDLRHHRVRADCADDLPQVKVDARLLAEALTHIVENAAKYSPEGSEIVVEADVEGDELRLIVTDQGPGVALEETERIFEKFYRGGRANGRRADGTGIGLAITRGLVEAHGGRVWAENLTNQGAKFTMALRVEHREAPLSKAPENEP